jgi:predicted DCC family thiol-disulfide oxidoreductase YuxK
MSSVADCDLTIPDQTLTSAPSWQISLLYDGECPLCLREVNFLRRKDAGRGLVKFVDITDDAYNPSENGGIEFADAMGRIHAVLPDGKVIQNIEVFRQIYAILGIGWLYAPTQWPILNSLVDWLYGIWARWRLRITGRPDLDTLVAERARRLGSCDVSGRCRPSEP